MAKTIRQIAIDKFKDRYDSLNNTLNNIKNKINSGKRPRRGTGTAGLKKNHNNYKLGGVK